MSVSVATRPFASTCASSPVPTATCRKRFGRVAFGEDLFYRLNVVPINLPPLRLRGDDLLALAEYYVAHFARKHGKAIESMSARSMERLRAYRWPGNVRELQNTLERAVIMTTPNSAVEVPELGLEEKRSTFGAFNVSDALPTVDEMERRLIGVMLLQTSQNKTRAAEKLGISLRTLRNKLREYRAAGFDTTKPELWVAVNVGGADNPDTRE